MAELASRVDGVGPLVNENPLGNRELLGFSREIFFSAFGVSPGKEWDQFLGGSINELIDGLIGDGVVRHIHGDPAGDQLGRPPQLYFSNHVISDDGIF